MTAPPRVVVFSLGGTIASVPAASTPAASTPAASAPAASGAGGVHPRLGASELVAAVPGLAELAEIEAVAFRQVPSGDLTLTDLAVLAEKIGAALARGAAGAVVTQGTDTVEESAFALDLMLDVAQPVVVTAAMRHPGQPGADGPANLEAAVRVAVSREGADQGVLVVLHDQVHAARFVRKAHTSSPAAFVSPGVGPIGWLVEGRVRLPFRLARLPHLPPGGVRREPPVALLPSFLGDDGRLLDRLGDAGYEGVVVEGLGGGHVPGVAADRLAALAAAMPVVLASRTGGGEVLTATYGYRGSERDLLGRGLIPAGYLTGPKARVLLALLLGSGAGRAEIAARFAQLAAG